MNKSKRIWVSLIVATSIILLTAGMAFADSNNLQINVDGKEVTIKCSNLGQSEGTTFDMIKLHFFAGYCTIVKDCVTIVVQ